MLGYTEKQSMFKKNQREKIHRSSQVKMDGYFDSGHSEVKRAYYENSERCRKTVEAVNVLNGLGCVRPSSGKMKK